MLSVGDNLIQDVYKRQLFDILPYTYIVFAAMLRNIFKCAELVYRLALIHFHTLDCDFAATYATSEHTVAKLIILIGKKLHGIWTVSYTHLDVYKRQAHKRIVYCVPNAQKQNHC